MQRIMARVAWTALVIPLLLVSHQVAEGQGRTVVIEQRGERRPVGDTQRDSLEGLVRARMGEVLKRQLLLSDEQSRRLNALSQRLQPRRRVLMTEERDVRGALRAQIAAGDSARESEITTLIDRMIQVQGARVALLEAEQKELATFLTPIQRARYLGLEEQMRLRVEEVQGRPMPGRPMPGRPMPGQGPPPGMGPGGMRRGGPPGEAQLELRRVPDPE